MVPVRTAEVACGEVLALTGRSHRDTLLAQVDGTAIATAAIEVAVFAIAAARGGAGSSGRERYGVADPVAERLLDSPAEGLTEQPIRPGSGRSGPMVTSRTESVRMGGATAQRTAEVSIGLRNV